MQGKHKSFPVVFKSAFGQIASAANFAVALRCFSSFPLPSLRFRLQLYLQLCSCCPKTGHCCYCTPSSSYSAVSTIPAHEQALSVREYDVAVTNQWLLLLPWVPRGRRKSVERRGICAAACRLWLCEGLSTEQGISSTPANQVELGKPKPFNSLTFRCTQILVLWKMCRFFLVRRGWPNAL